MISNPLIEEIVDLVNGDLLFTLFSKAIRGYEREEILVPVNTFVVSFVPSENKSSYFEDEDANTCLKSELTLKMTVYSHPSRAGKQINAIAELITDYLSDCYMGELTDYRIGDLKYDNNVSALTLPCYLHFTYLTCPLEGTEPEIPATVPESFFCRSHVSNTDLHFTPEEKELLNEPFVIGSYAGNGAADGQDIELGFKPKLVIVYRNSYHAALYSTSDGISKCYISVAAGSTYMRGLLITDNGFRARTVVTTNATTYLNDSGGTYTYIAFR